MTYKEWIEEQKKLWIGAKVRYHGNIYTVVDVDYNGGLLIDKKGQFTDTTAVDKWHLESVISYPYEA